MYFNPLIDLLVEWLMYWLFEWLIDWLFDWLIECLIDLLIGWLSDWLHYWLVGWVIDWLIDCIAEWPAEVVASELGPVVLDDFLHALFPDSHDGQPHQHRPQTILLTDVVWTLTRDTRGHKFAQETINLYNHVITLYKNLHNPVINIWSGVGWWTNMGYLEREVIL